MIPLARPLLALMLLAALIAAAACGGGGDDDRVAGVIHRLLLAAGTEGTELLESFPGALPDDLPVDVPVYPGAELLVSNRQPAPVTDSGDSSEDVPQPLLYFIVLDTSDSREDVYAFYEEALDQDPWQLQSSFSTEQLDTLQFFNVEDIDIGGVVSIAAGGDDGRTSVLVSLQDSGAFVEEEPPFVLQPSLALPSAFPPDVPLFEGATITGTAFFREPGLQSFLVVFLTTEDQDDVIEFYRDAFQANGWTVQDTDAFGLEGRIDFRDAEGDIQGDVFANRFPRDRDYTEVSVQVQLNPAREVAEPGASVQLLRLTRNTLATQDQIETRRDPAEDFEAAAAECTEQWIDEIVPFLVEDAKSVHQDSGFSLPDEEATSRFKTELRAAITQYCIDQSDERYCSAFGNAMGAWASASDDLDPRDVQAANFEGECLEAALEIP